MDDKFNSVYTKILKLIEEELSPSSVTKFWDIQRELETKLARTSYKDYKEIVEKENSNE